MNVRNGSKKSVTNTCLAGGPAPKGQGQGEGEGQGERGYPGGLQRL